MRIDKEIKRWQKKEMKVMKNLAKATGKGK
jgi:hypothetical protein